MNNAPVSGASLAKAVCCGVVIVLVLVWIRSQQANFIVFCDVGQGDGAYIRLENGLDIVIDAGSADMLECLGQYMPFYDNHIDFVFVTHPHLDHYGGLRDVMKVFSVETMFVPWLTTESSTYNQFLKLAQERSTVNYVSQPIRIRFAEQIYMDVMWPSAEFVRRHSASLGGGSGELPVSSYDPNAFSLVQLLVLDDSQVLFTGDIPFEILHQLIQSNNIENIDVFKVSHHGSRDGTSRAIIESLKPKTAILSYGIPNRYNHPSKEVTHILQQTNTHYYSTAEEGNIQLVYDAQGWKLHQSCFVFFSC